MVSSLYNACFGCTCSSVQSSTLQMQSTPIVATDNFASAQACRLQQNYSSSSLSSFGRTPPATAPASSYTHMRRNCRLISAPPSGLQHTRVARTARTLHSSPSSSPTEQVSCIRAHEDSSRPSRSPAIRAQSPIYTNPCGWGEKFQELVIRDKTCPWMDSSAALTATPCTCRPFCAPSACRAHLAAR
jgi:hypothetical protein